MKRFKTLIVLAGVLAGHVDVVDRNVPADTREKLQQLLAQDVRKIIITTIFKFGEATGSLNDRSNIIALVDEEPRKAQQMVRDLATLLRRGLDAAKTDEGTLREELEFIRLRRQADDRQSDEVTC